MILLDKSRGEVFYDNKSSIRVTLFDRTILV